MGNSLVTEVPEQFIREKIDNWIVSCTKMNLDPSHVHKNELQVVHRSKYNIQNGKLFKENTVENLDDLSLGRGLR